MAKQATGTALARPAPDTAVTVKTYLDTIPRYAEIKSLDRTKVVELAAKDWFDNNTDGVKLLTASYKVAESFADLITTSAPYVQKWRDLMRINGSKAMQTPDRTKWEALGIKTFKSFGLSVIAGTTVVMNGKEVEVTEDDPITWTKFCKVKFDRTPQAVNGNIRAAIGETGKAYQPDPDHQAPAQRTITPPSPDGGGPSTMQEYQVNLTPIPKEEDEDEDELPPAPKAKMIPVPNFKSGDIDALVNFLNADTVIGAVTPMDAIFGELSDFDLAKKAEQLARKIVEQYGTEKSTFTVKITVKKAKVVDQPIDEQVFTPANEVV